MLDWEKRRKKWTGDWIANGRDLGGGDKGREWTVIPLLTSVFLHCEMFKRHLELWGLRWKRNPLELWWSREARREQGKPKCFSLVFTGCSYHGFRPCAELSDCEYAQFAVFCYIKIIWFSGCWGSLEGNQPFTELWIFLLLKTFLVKVTLSFCKRILWCWVPFLTPDKGNGFGGKWAGKVWFCLLMEEFELGKAEGGIGTTAGLDFVNTKAPCSFWCSWLFWWIPWSTGGCRGVPWGFVLLMQVEKC